MTQIVADSLTGFVAGVSGVVLGHPFDTVKTRLQTGWHTQPSTHPIKITSVFRGISSPLSVVPLVMATTFAANEGTKRFFSHYFPNSSHITMVFVAGAVAGAAPSLFTTGSVYIKVQLQVHRSPTRVSYTRFIAKLWQRHGFCGWAKIYRMYYPLHTLQEVLGRAVWFSVYDYGKKLTTTPSEEVLVSHRIASGAASGILGWTAVYPLDTIKSVCFASKVPMPVSQAVADIWNRGGLRAFWRGYFLTITRTVPVAAVQLTTYDLVHPIVGRILNVSQEAPI
eukprot:TRINITY_DN14929_c0_g1_i1.p1 TRINITY_DN14929_c0_g1~~TRINITY_DN14929_c0_g1_i1.p1  ORF type:complete len:281 (-),score=28.86 TRINITY_DN14929_c0_g1_i1:27-869(-)